MGGTLDFWKTLVVLVRRWYVAVPTLVMSLGLAAVTFESVPPKFEASGSVVLLSPSGGASTSSDRVQTNPLLSFDDSLSTVSTALTQVLLSPQVVKELQGQGATADYEVGNGNLSGPFINVVADASSPAEAQQTVRLVLQRARTELRSREDAHHAPPATYIQVDNLIEPSEAKQLFGGKVRAGGAALALGLAASLSMAFLVESIGENRRERRRQQRRVAARVEARRDERDALDRLNRPDRLNGLDGRVGVGGQSDHNGQHHNGQNHNGQSNQHPSNGVNRGGWGHRDDRNRYGVHNGDDITEMTERIDGYLGVGAKDAPSDELSAMMARRARGRAQG